jgi:hypothetical protein
MHFAVNQRVPPKNVDPRLVMLRDARLLTPIDAELDELATNIRDHNYRVFAGDDKLHLISAGVRLTDADPFLLFDKLLATSPKNLDASHAFYLGFELAKATIANSLGKNYTQDEALDWGYLTRPERSHRLK